MSDFSAIRQRLEQAVAQGQRPEGAIRLLKRLTSPVRIAILGRSGVGKSALAEVLALQTDLSDCSITEVTIGEAGATQVLVATAQADLVLWCGQDFTPADLDAWAEVPDGVKDHSFLVLTKADTLVAQGQLQPILLALGPVVANEFHSLFPVASLQATAASGPAPGQAFRASGAAALTAALSRQIALGQQALRDSALVFLGRYGGANAPTPQPATSDWTKPHAYLDQRAAHLTPALALSEADKARHVLAHCCETVDELIEMIPPDSAALTEEVLALSDTMLLLQLEGSPMSAVDALTRLLQVRRTIASCPIE